MALNLPSVTLTLSPCLLSQLPSRFLLPQPQAPEISLQGQSQRAGCHGASSPFYPDPHPIIQCQGLSGEKLSRSVTQEVKALVWEGFPLTSGPSPCPLTRKPLILGGPS